MRIFITGFRHSGTTMTMQLIKSHPQVGWIENEESYIEFDKPKKWVLMMAGQKVDNLKKQSWGEKIPWGVRPEDKNGARAIKMIKKWLNYFEEKGRVVQVLRHPVDVIMSGRNGNNIPQKELNWQVNTVERVIDTINKNKRCGVVVYEELVSFPEIVLPRLFEFLNLNSNPKVIKKIINTPLKFGKINADRAFAYKQKKIKTDYDYAKLVRKVRNRI